MNKQAEEIRNLYFPVLDEGFVALKDWMGGDDAIVEAARTSYGAGTRPISDDRQLIRYLLRHRHTSPLEFVELKFHVKLPIFVARQLIRHRTFSTNEYSGRYSLMPMLFYTPDIDGFSLQSKSNRQGREDILKLTDDEQHALSRLYRATTDRWDENRKNLADQYEDLVNEGVARELARIDLPLSMYTEWYWKVDLHNLMHMLALRCDPHAQLEARMYANVMAGMAGRVAPMAMEAWIDYRHAGVTLSFSEIELIREFMGATDDEVFPATVKSLSWDQVEDKGLEFSKRERAEFIAKLLVPAGGTVRPEFNLDVTTARPHRYFEERAAAAVPKVDT